MLPLAADDVMVKPLNAIYKIALRSLTITMATTAAKVSMGRDQTKRLLRSVQVFHTLLGTV